MQDGTSTDFAVNGATFTSPTVPVLLQILSGTQSAADLLPSGSIFALPANSSIEISLPGGVAGGAHPFHLHGVSSLSLSPLSINITVFFMQQTLDVVRRAGRTKYNYENPVSRDVVRIGGAEENVTIRLEVRNLTFQ